MARGHTVEDLTRAVRPHLRGWLHAVTSPLALASGIVLVVLAPTTRATVAAAAYATTRATIEMVYGPGMERRLRGAKGLVRALTGRA